MRILNRNLPRLSVLIMVLLLVPHAELAEALSFWDDVPDEQLLPDLLDAMTPEELIGQTLMLGWLGEDPSADVLGWLRTTNLGGVKVFGWNGGDLVRLARAIGTMQEVAVSHRLEIPLLTATDQEGGWVRHVKGSGDLTTMITPGNMAIGAANLPYDAYRSAYFIGAELRALGINMNFAPTVDVYVNPEAHVIGPRAFSNDPVQSGVLGVAFYHGLEEARVISTAKHFPGHGNAADDSHGVLPVLEDSWEELVERDLVPFRFLINEGVPAVLSGHLNFPNISGDGRPASLSAAFKQRILREELGFDGLIITDDLYMVGAWEYGADRGWGIEEIVIESLRVGNDMVMLSKTPEPAGTLLDRTLEYYHENAAFRRRIRDAAAQVVQLKLDYLKPDDRVPLVPDVESLSMIMRESTAGEFFRDQAGRSVTIVRDAAIPLTVTADERVLLAGKDRDFLRIGAEFIPQAETYRIDSSRFFTASPADQARFRALAERHDTIIFCLSDPHTAQLLEAISDLDVTVIAYSILTPVYLAGLPWVDSALAVYGWGVESFRAGYSALLGRTPAPGRLPVTLDGASRE
ncbi:MAG: glycoside hydrolase family 3 protein [Spirochaetota bacterium]